MDAPNLLALLFSLGIIFLWIASVAWAVGDAQKRGYTGGHIVFLLWLFGPFSALIWRVFRPRTVITEIAPESYDNPDDAIAEAVKLDMLGEWNTAIAVYRDAASR